MARETLVVGRLTLRDCAYLEQRGGQRVTPGFSYNSGTNERFLTVDELRGLIGINLRVEVPA